MDILKTRKQNLLALIEEAGSRQAFIKRTGKSDGQVGQLLRDEGSGARNVGHRLARELEEVFRKPVGWMDIRHDQAAIRLESDQVRSPSGEYNASQVAMIPLLQEAAQSDLATPSRVIKDPDQLTPILNSSLHSAGLVAKNVVAAIVPDNSMEPVLPRGTVAFVDETVSTVREGDLYCMDHGGLLRIRLLYRLPGGGLRLRSYNQLEHPDEELSREQVQKLAIIGRLFSWTVVRPNTPTK